MIIQEAADVSDSAQSSCASRRVHGMSFYPLYPTIMHDTYFLLRDVVIQERRLIHMTKRKSDRSIERYTARRTATTQRRRPFRASTHNRCSRDPMRCAATCNCVRTTLIAWFNGTRAKEWSSLTTGTTICLRFTRSDRSFLLLFHDFTPPPTPEVL